MLCIKVGFERDSDVRLGLRKQMLFRPSICVHKLEHKCRENVTTNSFFCSSKKKKKIFSIKKKLFFVLAYILSFATKCVGIYS